jgi:hypothetical protein
VLALGPREQRVADDLFGELRRHREAVEVGREEAE